MAQGGRMIISQLYSFLTRQGDLVDEQMRRNKEIERALRSLAIRLLTLDGVTGSAQ
jgi:hypothetical protein